MTPHVQVVMARYRELKAKGLSGLEASYQTRVEFESGFVPTRSVPTADVLTCECGKPREGRYAKCSACRKRAYRERSRG